MYLKLEFRARSMRSDNVPSSSRLMVTSAFILIMRFRFVLYCSQTATNWMLKLNKHNSVLEDMGHCPHMFRSIRVRVAYLHLEYAWTRHARHPSVHAAAFVAAACFTIKWPSLDCVDMQTITRLSYF
ncbi:hypothetical protein TSO5_15945 [Azospirillum sp. TSO5]|nr:hypothetical protein TSO5_15945 [Azospirillum sp. TSO5]